MNLKSLLPSLAVAGGIFLATSDAGNAVACPFSKGKDVFISHGAMKIAPGHLALGIGAGAVALSVAGVLAYRYRPAGRPETDGGIEIPSAFPIPVPPSALTGSDEAEEVENAHLP
jgi:hypothetical protein